MTDTASNIRSLKQLVPRHVKIVAVSKTMPADIIKAAYDGGHRIFGENRVDELVKKSGLLPGDIEWHFVGHLQTNKVKLLINNVSMIQSVDSLRLLQVIERESQKAGKQTACLLQFHIASEETKYGFSIDEAMKMHESGEIRKLSHVIICGVMGMATFTDNHDIVREEFSNLRGYFERLKNLYYIDNSRFREISMGMSDDYQVAIEEGATMVRIGTLIFGERNKL